MKKACLAVLLAGALLLSACLASAEVFFIPNGIKSIEEEAFYDIGSADSAYVPKSVKEISDSAFSESVETVFGHPGTAAQAYAQRTGRIFSALDVPETEDPFIPVSAVSLFPSSPEAIYTGETLSLTAVSRPENYGNDMFAYVSLHPSVAKVSADGVVRGVGVGRAQILCIAKDGGGAYDHITVTVLQGVQEISLYVPENTMLPGAQMLLIATPLPFDAGKSDVFFSSSNPEIASIDQDGLITAHAPGIITLTASCENGVSASVTLRVLSPGKPLTFTVTPSSVTLSPGETKLLSHKALPEGSDESAEWFSDNPSIATVSESGLLQAKSAGTCLIYARSTVDRNVFATCKVTVLSDSRTLTMPLRRTGTGDVSNNLARIESVKDSAMRELESLKARGKLSSSVMSKRKAVISNAFSMYAFPWMTKGYQEYWKAENSENGAKDFKPGTVYYGLPYTADYQNRQYNVQKAVSENRYTPAAKGYYLNQNNLLNGKYVGNDCSSMLSISFFGFTSQTATFNTRSFYSSDRFTTLSAAETLMPGDILVKNGRHVVMFLYYANASKTQIVVIEQGGSEAGINTLSTGLYSLSYYLNNGYIPRRLSDWT